MLFTFAAAAALISATSAVLVRNRVANNGDAVVVATGYDIETAGDAASVFKKAGVTAMFPISSTAGRKDLKALGEKLKKRKQVMGIDMDLSMKQLKKMKASKLTKKIKSAVKLFRKKAHAKANYVYFSKIKGEKMAKKISDACSAADVIAVSTKHTVKPDEKKMKKQMTKALKFKHAAVRSFIFALDSEAISKDYLKAFKATFAKAKKAAKKSAKKASKKTAQSADTAEAVEAQYFKLVKFQDAIVYVKRAAADKEAAPATEDGSNSESTSSESSSSSSSDDDATSTDKVPSRRMHHATRVPMLVNGKLKIYKASRSKSTRHSRRSRTAQPADGTFAANSKAETTAAAEDGAKSGKKKTEDGAKSGEKKTEDGAEAGKKKAENSAEAAKTKVDGKDTGSAMRSSAAFASVAMAVIVGFIACC